ncbi:hypothetical protein ACFVWL_08440 [Microbacterium sp. NPDC058269]|uniref:hypothetical protein n=1 Tax=Microbacterium sp. NPDC058269 TaxID=3346414 RepID=UPI0036D7E353
MVTSSSINALSEIADITRPFRLEGPVTRPAGADSHRARAAKELTARGYADYWHGLGEKPTAPDIFGCHGSHLGRTFSTRVAHSTRVHVLREARPSVNVTYLLPGKASYSSILLVSRMGDLVADGGIEKGENE